MKTCIKCNIKKPLSEYYKHKTNIDGLYGTCKICCNSNSKKYHKDNYEKVSKLKKKRDLKKSGIYEWHDNGISLYIGQSYWLISRINCHKCWLKNPSIAPKSSQYLYQALQQHPNASIRVIEECPRKVLLEREQHYINVRKPLYNKYVVTTQHTKNI